MRKFAYYYQEIENTEHPNDNVPALIDLHNKSFEKHGWEVLKVDEETARQHPKYKLFDDPSTPLGLSGNPWVYTRACFMRWLAYSVAGCYFADYDVLNYGFTSQDADNIISESGADTPIFLSLAGAVGLVAPDGYERIIQTYEDFIENPVVGGVMAQDINDMTIMRHLRPDWYLRVPYEDIRFSKDYTNPGWQETKLVHYPYYFTKSPRFEIARAARQF